jgi:hypothetical protein
VAFALLPHRYLHESWRPELMAEPLWRLLAASPRTEGRLAAFVGEKLGLATVPAAGFEGPQARFCLLPGEALARIAQRVGLVLNCGRIAKSIDGKLVGRLRHELGPEAYEFAVRRASLITTRTDPRPPDFAAAVPFDEQFMQSGVNFIGLALGDLEAGLRARLALRLPKVLAPLLQAPQGEVEASTAWSLVRKVIREAAPEWNALLA